MPVRIEGLLLALVVFAWTNTGFCATVSPTTEECLGCHLSISPGIVGAWEKSRHARVNLAEARKKKGLGRIVSSDEIPEELMEFSIGCSECHTMNHEKHKDTFEHNGFNVHIVVTPSDCSTCHAVEADQFTKNLMSYAHTNLVNNELYQDLIESINGTQLVKDGQVVVKPSDALTNADSCLFCHGTAVEVRGTYTKETDMGEMEFLFLSGWPNQGVGRLNPDGSQGSCTACHARHQFSIEMARKPYTCSECHKGLDVPASKVYAVSKHGNIYSSVGGTWNFSTVPWTIGKDFTAPTCAVCHVSLLVDGEGTVVAERSHRMNDRLPWRIFGLIYAHPHPKSPDLTVIKNKAGIPLPTELKGPPVAEFLISPAEQEKRRENIQTICFTCHGEAWVRGHWERLEHSITTSNEMTLTATLLLTQAWSKGLAKGPGQGDSIFNETIEKMWVEQWLFYANSIRFSSAMCGADYGVFDNGRWYLSKNIQEMKDWINMQIKLQK